MKTISKIGLAASLCVMGLSTQAQFLNDFYHFNGLPADHGDAAKVITTAPTMLNSNQYYVTAGSSPSNTISAVPSVFLSEYDLNGNNIFHKTFLINTPKAANTTQVDGLVQVTNNANAGYALLAFTNSAPAQSVVIKTDLNGNLVWKSEVGRNAAASLAYDFDMDRLLVLTSISAGSSSDLQLVVLRGSDGSVVFTEHFDGFNNSNDSPARVLYDPFTRNYLLVGTSLVKNVLGTESELMLVRLSNTGALNYTRTIGLNGIDLSAVDATINPRGTSSEVVIGGLVVGVIAGNSYVGQPSYTRVDILTGTNARVNLLRQNFALKAITMVPEASSLDIVGNQASGPFNTAKLFSVDPTDPTFVGLIHNYNQAFTSFSFNDINHGVASSLVAAGGHKVPFSFGGSPAGTSFEWLVTADASGTGKCDVADTLSSFIFAVPVESNNVTGVAFNKTPVTIESLSQTEDKVDGCDVPFRLPKNNNAISENAGFRLYPNPASDLLMVEFSATESDNVQLNVMDMTGRVVLSEKLVGGEHATTSLNVSDLAGGVYYTDLRVNGASVGKDKIVVQH